MKFIIEREKLLKPLQLISGVVERRQTLPILANILLVLKNNELALTGTDLEVELMGKVILDGAVVEGSITVPARKLMDICRTLPENSLLEFFLQDTKLIIKSGRSRFSLATLASAEFPNTSEQSSQQTLEISQQALCELIESTQFAMAQQDVRYYLNGMLLEVKNNKLTSVATDGHRMALSAIDIDSAISQQIIVPRKAIAELTKLLAKSTEVATVLLGANQLQVKTTEYVFTSKLIDGHFPDYSKVIPKYGDKILILDRYKIKQTLNRVAILASEKHRGVRLELRAGLLRVITNNPEQEEAEEELNIIYDGTDLDIGFNIVYLLDAIAALKTDQIKFILSNADNSVRIEAFDNDQVIYVVMPMRI